MFLCGMLEMRTRKQQLESVGKKQKDHFQLQCLMAVGSKVSMDGITPSWIFQKRKLEAVLFRSGAFWVLAFWVVAIVLCCSLQASVTHLTLLFQRHFIFLFFYSLLFMIMKYFILSPQILQIQFSLQSVQLLFKNKIHFFSCFDTSHLPF